MIRGMLSHRDLIGDATEFPILKSWRYFNHAGVSPWPARTVRAVREFSDRFGVDCFQSFNPDHDLAALRELLATMIGAKPFEIALMRNTGDAISQIASGLHWQQGDVVVASAAEYPSNLYPWMEAMRRAGGRVELVPETIADDGTARVEESALIDAARRHRAKLLAVSHVQWGTGQRMDLHRLGTFCRDAGVLFAVDAIQSLGVVPVDVARDHIDFLFSGGHKWLMSPPGAGLLFCRGELHERICPASVGWLSVVNPYRWEFNYTLRTEAGRFETGTHAYPSLIGMKSSVQFLLDLGIDAIHAHVASLGAQFAEGLRSLGWTMVSDRRGAVGGAVCFLHPTLAPEVVVKRLRERCQIELAARTGRLRFSPHLYNTPAEVASTIEALRDPSSLRD
jgi:cysteine desulfurase / selenocysteine lyase